MNIRVGNLAPTTSLLELRGRFEVFGAVTDIEIGTYKVAGGLRSLGFIAMPSRKCGQAAIDSLQSSELDGSLLSVREDS